jgi:hypothetical protein
MNIFIDEMIHYAYLQNNIKNDEYQNKHRKSIEIY